jgi:hypothetical protein
METNMTVVEDMMFDDFFSQRLPQEGFVIQPTSYVGLVHEQNRPELHGYAITMAGEVVVPELKPPVETEMRAAA